MGHLRGLELKKPGCRDEVIPPSCLDLLIPICNALLVSGSRKMGYSHVWKIAEAAPKTLGEEIDKNVNQLGAYY